MFPGALTHNHQRKSEGNEVELMVNDTEHTIIKVAAIEMVFSTLKKYGCFLMQFRLHLQ